MKLYGQTPKIVFFVFPNKKDWFSVQKRFGPKTQLFPRKNFGFWAEKQTFSRKQVVLVLQKPAIYKEKTVLGRTTNFFLGKTKKKTCFWSLAGRIASQRWFCWFLGGLSVQSHLFPRKRLIFLPKTIFFLGKVVVSLQNHIFPTRECVFHLSLAHVT